MKTATAPPVEEVQTSTSRVTKKTKPDPLAQRINDLHHLYQDTASSAGAKYWDVGDALLKAKKTIPHGGWEPWIRDHLVFDERQAQRYMRIAKTLTRAEASVPTLLAGGIDQYLESISTPLTSDGTVISSKMVYEAARAVEGGPDAVVAWMTPKVEPEDILTAAEASRATTLTMTAEKDIKEPIDPQIAAAREVRRRCAEHLIRLGHVAAVEELARGADWDLDDLELVKKDLLSWVQWIK